MLLLRRPNKMPPLLDQWYQHRVTAACQDRDEGRASTEKQRRYDIFFGRAILTTGSQAIGKEEEAKGHRPSPASDSATKGHRNGRKWKLEEKIRLATAHRAVGAGPYGQKHRDMATHL